MANTPEADARADEVVGYTVQCLACRSVLRSRAAITAHAETGHREFVPHGVLYGNGRLEPRDLVLNHDHSPEPFAPVEE